MQFRSGTQTCKCGNSKNKPFCDCSHLNLNFKG
ncbi:MAG: CDGSH iron-sulfur domain-containing protein [Ignavibacteria bacterium]|nr:CDGSH iron-sulfur domain-containing protein [Ignavibacteria bacterium]